MDKDFGQQSYSLYNLNPPYEEVHNLNPPY